MTRFGPAEEHALRPHGRGELPRRRRRGRRRPDRGRRGDHARGRAGRPQRRRGQRVGLPRRGSLGGPPGPGARILLAASHPAVAHPAAQPDGDPRDRGRDLPAAIGDPGVRDPACCGDAALGARPYLHLASPGPARPATRGVARMAELAQVTALAVEPVPPPPPPPLTTGPDSPDQSTGEGRAGSGPPNACRTHWIRVFTSVRTLARTHWIRVFTASERMDSGFHDVPPALGG